MTDGKIDPDQNTIIRLVYYSTIELPFGPIGDAGMADIMRVACRENALSGITGILYSDGAYFMQILEGPASSVDALFAKIRQDQRHTAVMLVQRDTIVRRDFAAWTMVFVDEAELLRAGPVIALLPDAPRRGVDAFIPAMHRVLAQRATPPSGPAP